MCSSAVLKTVLAITVLLMNRVWRADSLTIDGITVPNQFSHEYHEEISSDRTTRLYLVQEKQRETFLLCPKFTAIEKISYGLADAVKEDKQTKKEFITTKNYTLTPDSPQFASSSNFCPTLAMCLLRQACVFRLGNEFCHQDPRPGQQKVIKIEITCTLEMTLRRTLGRFSNLSRADETVFLRFRSKLDSGLRDYKHIIVHELVSREQEVFEKSCPDPDLARSQGFLGKCLKIGKKELPSLFWTVLIRASLACKRRLLEVACALLADPAGRCHVPSSSGHDFQTLPMMGHRPDTSRLNQLQRSSFSQLVPARLGFILLAHKDVPSLLQLLESIYDRQNYYVIHLDRNSEHVAQELSPLLQGLHNVRLLPPERSFATSWGSYGIVRAQLEAIEELLRMGVWDHVINLSGSDLPLRPVSDISALLASFRGVSFFSTFGGFKDDHGNRPVTVECENHVYNLGIKHSTDKQVKLKGSSQWFIMARALAEYTLKIDENTELRQRLFRFRHLGIPDEFFFSTVLFASQFRDTFINKNLRFINRFEPKNIDGLCRHQDDADFCGQGPADFTSDDIERIRTVGAAFNFFARKFDTGDSGDDLRLEVLANNINGEILQKIHRGFFWYFVEDAFNYFDNQIAVGQIRNIFIDDFKILPSVRPSGDNCDTVWSHQRLLAEKFLLWTDITTVFRSGEKERFRLLLEPEPLVRCFSKGNLAAVTLDWFGYDEDTQEQGRYLHTLPYVDEGATKLTFQLTFDLNQKPINYMRKNIYKDFSVPLQKRNNTKQNVSDVLKFHVDFVIQEYSRGIRCSDAVLIKLPSPHQPGSPGSRLLFHTLNVQCPQPLKAGKYLLLLNQYQVANPRQYHFTFYVVARGERPGSKDSDFMREIWTLRSIMSLPFNDTWYYSSAKNNDISSHWKSPDSRRLRLVLGDSHYAAELEEKYKSISDPAAKSLVQSTNQESYNGSILERSLISDVYSRKRRDVNINNRLSLDTISNICLVVLFVCTAEGAIYILLPPRLHRRCCKLTVFLLMTALLATILFSLLFIVTR